MPQVEGTFQVPEYSLDHLVWLLHVLAQEFTAKHVCGLMIIVRLIRDKFNNSLSYIKYIPKPKTIIVWTHISSPLTYHYQANSLQIPSNHHRISSLLIYNYLANFLKIIITWQTPFKISGKIPDNHQVEPSIQIIWQTPRQLSGGTLPSNHLANSALIIIR